MALAFEGDSRVNAVVGNYFSLFAIQPTDKDANWVAHFGLEGAGYFSMRQADGRYPLETADGLIGVYTEIAHGDFQWQLRYTHISAHLADGSSENPIPYSRETLGLRVGFVPSHVLHLYAGASMIANTTPQVSPWGFQTGGSLFWPWNETSLSPFLAWDTQVRQEWVYNPSVNLQVGVALNNPPEAYRSFRIYYSLFTGSDPRGQFSTRRLIAHTIGIEMQI